MTAWPDTAATEGQAGNQNPFFLGFFTHVHGPEAGELYRGVVDLFVAAEELGYDRGWVAQHHFHPDYGRLPSPLVLLGAAAARTSWRRSGGTLKCWRPRSRRRSAGGHGLIADRLIADGPTRNGRRPRMTAPDAPAPRRLGVGALVYRTARAGNLTIRQLAQRVTDDAGTLVGTPDDVAGHIEEWFTGGGADGFNVVFPYLPGTLDDFTGLVIPELQRRGLFRTSYPGRTLRGHLGLPRPASRQATHPQGRQAK